MSARVLSARVTRTTSTAADADVPSGASVAFVLLSPPMALGLSPMAIWATPGMSISGIGFMAQNLATECDYCWTLNPEGGKQAP